MLAFIVLKVLILVFMSVFKSFAGFFSLLKRILTCMSCMRGATQSKVLLIIFTGCLVCYICYVCSHRPMFIWFTACREPKVSELVRQRVLPPQAPFRYVSSVLLYGKESVTPDIHKHCVLCLQPEAF